MNTSRLSHWVDMFFHYFHKAWGVMLLAFVVWFWGMGAYGCITGETPRLLEISKSQAAGLDDITRRQLMQELTEGFKFTPEPLAPLPPAPLSTGVAVPSYIKIAAQANPKYHTGKAEYTTNCLDSVITYELRRRGYNVTAKPNYERFPNSNIILSIFPGIYVHGLKGHNKTYLSRQSLLSRLQAMPDGARGCIDWEFTGVDGLNDGHIISFEKYNGNIIFIDPQQGIIGDYLLSDVCTSGYHYSRLDHLPLARGVVAQH